ncbi:hypothetical protein V8C86DRAFT_3027934 [Haematococcus lacustris]
MPQLKAGEAQETGGLPVQACGVPLPSLHLHRLRAQVSLRSSSPRSPSLITGMRANTWLCGAAQAVDDDSTSSQAAELLAPSLGPWSALSFGSGHAAAVTTRGKLYCWGQTTEGQCGSSTSLISPECGGSAAGGNATESEPAAQCKDRMRSTNITPARVRSNSMGHAIADIMLSSVQHPWRRARLSNVSSWQHQAPGPSQAPPAHAPFK